MEYPLLRGELISQFVGTLTLNDALSQALQGKKGVSITGAVEAVLALGHKSRSKNFRLLVTQALCNSDRFKRVGKALYALNP